MTKISRKFCDHTTMYDYFDKNGHGDGDNVSAGMAFRHDAAKILERELDKAFPEDNVEVRTDVVSSMHNSCRLAVFVHSLDGREDVEIRTNCCKNELKYIEHFDKGKFKAAFKKAAESFGGKGDVV